MSNDAANHITQLLKQGGGLYQQGKLPDALATVSKALTMAKAQLPPTHPLLAAR